MPALTTMTIELSQDVKDKLDALASGTEQSSTRLASEAVGTFVEEEFALRDAIERGKEDGRAGRVVSHSRAIADMRDAIDAARRNRAK
ncbi:CopG family transcriptional regulator [Rhizobium sp. Root274]|nr:CopG family transcriptional regulator [Rhizobium sp. Root1240]KRD33935.1 CopG family transcriptional regulator [Rhizobium sp. Root274]